MLRVLCIAVCAASAAAQSAAGGENIGVPVASLPIPEDKCSAAATNDAEMRLTVFTWGYDNHYWMAKQDENWGDKGGMGQWKDIGGFFAGGATVIRNANNDIVVFGRDEAKRIDYKVFHPDGLEEAWETLGGNIHGSRVLALVDPQGLIHVFGRGKDSGIYERRQFANGTEAVWGDWTSLGGALSSNPAGLVDAEGVIHLFARGIDGKLWTMTQQLEESGSLTWKSWKRADNSVLLSSAATIVPKLNAQNLIEVFVRGADKAFWYTRQTVNDNRGVIWSPFKSLGGVWASAPSVVMNADSLLTVYGRAVDKGVWYRTQAHHPVDSPSDAWSAWNDIGGRFSASVDAIPDSRGYINLFGRGLDRSLYYRSQKYQNRSVEFYDKWNNMGGRFRPFPC